jgi:hypothetical protein
MNHESRRLNANHVRRFERLVRELNELRADVEAEGFDANWYLDDDTLNLMGGPTHTEDGKHALQEHALQENVLISARLLRSGGGGW